MRVSNWIARRGAVLLTVAWIVVFALEITAPLMVEICPATAGMIYTVLRPLCHQRPERSFHIAGHKMGLCTRCTGVFGGLTVFGIIAIIFRWKKGLPFWGMLILLAPLAIDGIGQTFGFWDTGNLLRFFTGLLASFGIVFWIYPIIFEFEGEYVETTQIDLNKPG